MIVQFSSQDAIVAVIGSIGVISTAVVLLYSFRRRAHLHINVVEQSGNQYGHIQLKGEANGKAQLIHRLAKVTRRYTSKHYLGPTTVVICADGSPTTL